MPRIRGTGQGQIRLSACFSGQGPPFECRRSDKPLILRCDTGVALRGEVVGVDGNTPPGYAITRDDLLATVVAQGSDVRAGDVVLVRTGFATLWDHPEEYLAAAGVSGAASAWLAAQGVAAVGSDNMAWDVVGAVDPALCCTLPGHLVLLARHGIHIIENLNLEELARDRRYAFAFFCAPVKWTGATGSPVRPVALCPA